MSTITAKQAKSSMKSCRISKDLQVFLGGGRSPPSDRKSCRIWKAQHGLLARAPVIIIAALFFLLLTPAFSTTQLVSFQGRILQSGSPAASGNIAVTIWSASDEGSVLYSDNFPNAINDGFFDLMLGSSSELNLTYGTFYHLDMSINGQDINWTSPSGSTVNRVQFQSQNGQISSGQIQLNAVNASHIQNDAVTSAKIAPSAVNSSHIKNGTITADAIATGAINSTHILNNTIRDNNISPFANISGAKVNVTGFCPAPSNYTGYPCYSHFGCSPPGNYTQCLADPNNPANSPCFNNTAAWRLQSCPFTCPANMAKIIDTRYGAGVFCVDRWEAYNNGGVAGSGRGQTPYVSINRDDAATACTNAGKHLCTSQEWLASCNYGSFSYLGIDDDPPCVTGVAAAEGTGTNVGCRTTDGVYDMVGNVWEWTDAGLTVDNPDASWSSGHTGSGDGTGWYTDDDGYWFTTTTGRAFVRGGDWSTGALDGCFTLYLADAPSLVSTGFGFRCCK